MGKYVQLTIQEMDIQREASCLSDYVEIYNDGEAYFDYFHGFSPKVLLIFAIFDRFMWNYIKHQVVYIKNVS